MHLVEEYTDEQDGSADPFYNREARKLFENIKIEKNDSKSDTKASDNKSTHDDRLVTQKNPVTGLKMTAKERDMLDEIHKIRVETFETRVNDPLNEKPYLPMLSSDEKEVIMEQYFASKKKLSQVV